jgi:hypothetical protein
MWTILACPAPGGGKPVDVFVARLGPQAHNAFSTVLGDLATLERRFWVRPQFDVLHGDNYREMGEIRFKGENKQYRVFGFFGPQRMQFTLLSGHIKQRGNLKHEMDEAAKRKKFAEANQGVLYVFEL